MYCKTQVFVYHAFERYLIAGSSRESRGTRAPRPLDSWERCVCTSAHLVFLMFEWEGSTTGPSLVAFFVLWFACWYQAWSFDSVSLVPFRVHMKGRCAYSGRGVSIPYVLTPETRTWLMTLMDAIQMKGSPPRLH